MTHAAAVGRLPLYVAIVDPASETFSAASVRSAARHFRLPNETGKPKRRRSERYPIGFFHIDNAEVQTAQGKLYLFVDVDRTSKFAVTQLVDEADRQTAWEFLRHLPKEVPYHSHTILAHNGIQIAEQPIMNSMAEAFVRTLKRGYVQLSPRPDARTVIDQLPGWIVHYNEAHPHRSPPRLHRRARLSGRWKI